MQISANGTRRVKGTHSLNSKTKTLVIKVVFLTHMGKRSLIMMFDENLNSNSKAVHLTACFCFLGFFYPPPPIGYFWSVSLVSALLYSCGHSHSPPLTRHYVSYLISTFVEIRPGHNEPTRECTYYDQSCHKSM